MLSPFLLDGKEIGGMGLDTEAVGIIYGTFGVGALTLGGILGGIAISKQGLTKWMLPMFLAMHLPIIGFILLVITDRIIPKKISAKNEEIYYLT